MTTETRATPADSRRDDLRFLVIGAGMSGILSAIELQEADLDDFEIYEKPDRLGGTWRENTYPGIACDVPSHSTATPSPRTRSGAIAATGVLHHPRYPDIEGLDGFEGACFHSARWDHEVALAGKRVGVVGTGSSAIQIVSALVDRVEELTLFQRTPQWITPIENPPYTEEEKGEFRKNPEAMKEIRKEVSRAFTEGFANILVDAESPLMKLIHDDCVANIENSVKDPELREKLRPDYRAACKRLIMSEDFYDAIQKPNARLVMEGIERVDKAGVRTRDGRLHELDVLVLATGVRVDSFVRPIKVTGRGGVLLDDVWRDGSFAYEAISVPDFPNFFMLNGPNSPVGDFDAR